MKQITTCLTMCAALALGAGACVTEETEDFEQAELTELARATAADGAVYVFSEGEPGELILQVSSDDIRADELAEIDSDEVAFTDVYERVAGTRAPDALRLAQDRSDALRELRQDFDEEDFDENGASRDGMTIDNGIGSVSQGISSSDFQDAYCASASWDYRYCWPSTSGNPWVQRKAYTMYGYMAAVSHTTRFRFRYKTVAAGSWKTLVDAQALPGQVHHVYQRYFGYKRWRRWEILNNDGKAVRYSCYGTD